MGGHEGGPQLVAGVGAGFIMKHMAYKMDRVDRKGHQYVVVTSNRVHHVLKRGLALSKAKPRGRVIRPESRNLDLLLSNAGGRQPLAVAALAAVRHSPL